MKRILYFDAAAGVSGDMFVGALLDLGASLDQVRSHVAALGVPGIELRARKVTNHGIAGTKFDVLDPESGRPVDALQDHDHDHDHGHDGHAHSHHHEHHHHHAHSHHHEHHDHDHDGHAHGHHHEHRGLREIRRLIHESKLPAPVAGDALAVFELIATAEAKVHGMALEDVHFHEVGALDAIGDVVAAASAFHLIGADEAWCSPVHVGCGTVRCAHGVLPVPAPATLELLKGMPTYSDGIQGELATPTGAALLRRFCKGFSPMPPLVVEAVGYGAGTKDFGIPNLFRATLGTSMEKKRARLAAAAG
jgi:pyridinium-3,5-bisthiocarboxylic acid mononucleotide nickel chelatase